MRILFVAMAESVHTARWIEQIVDQGWDIHLFAATESRPHAALRGVTTHSFYKYPDTAYDKSLRQTGVSYPFPRGATKLRKMLERTVPAQYGAPARLSNLIKQLQPDIIHSLEMQRAGYLTLDALNASPLGVSWIYSCWGNDIYYFAGQPDHQSRVRKVLSRCNYLITDCERDVALARQHGFSGEVLGVLPVGGGFETAMMQDLQQPGNPSRRNIIMVKGYQHETWGGRALNILEALILCADALRSYEIVIYSACQAVREKAEMIMQETNLRLRILPQVAHSQIIALMGQARIAVGMSISDGIPNTMLEAMIMGAFPIQSDTVSTAEWIADGKNGLLVPPENPNAISRAIRQALEDDQLVDGAARLNLALVSRVERQKVKREVVDIYNHVYTRHKNQRKQVCAS